MAHLRKKPVELFTVLIICSMLLIGSCVAVEIAKPVTPTFTVEEISDSQVVPPFSTTDPYTGETINLPGYTVEYKGIYIKIKNQPFDQPLTMIPGDGLNRLSYQYRYKGHYEDDGRWKIVDGVYTTVIQSYSEYTLISFPDNIPRRGQADIQVRAVIGHFDELLTSIGSLGYEFVGVLGDWSDIVVVSFNPLSFTVLPSTSTPSTDTPDQLTPDYTTPPSTTDSIDPQPPNAPPQQSPWASYLLTIIVTACIVIIPIVVVTYLNKRQQRKTNQTQSLPTTPFYGDT